MHSYEILNNIKIFFVYYFSKFVHFAKTIKKAGIRLEKSVKYLLLLYDNRFKILFRSARKPVFHAQRIHIAYRAFN